MFRTSNKYLLRNQRYFKTIFYIFAIISDTVTLFRRPSHETESDQVYNRSWICFGATLSKNKSFITAAYSIFPIVKDSNNTSAVNYEWVARSDMAWNLTCDHLTAVPCLRKVNNEPPFLVEWKFLLNNLAYEKIYIIYTVNPFQ